ncbi:fibronectin type III domain-containing protein [Candidatus Poriferisodalis sp.]|uniref:fibronectin type III domain-containing protein n=1 Tax=Candidatus Poriferisodalis sp. TaxID=3101277 RepID=UPI003B518E22
MVKPFRLLLAGLAVATIAVTLAVPAGAQEPGVYLDGAEPWVASDCDGDVPIVVGSDARAQSDIYSAVTLAGVVDTDCIVLVGPRDGQMPAAQLARLDDAAAGGYVLGGLAAVPAAKVSNRGMTRIAGADRWTTARLVGNEARALAGGVSGTASPGNSRSTLPADVRSPGVYLDGAEPWIASDCVGDIPIVVGSDAKAQSDIYSAVTLAGVVDTDCIVLAGPRDGQMPTTQRARLVAAAAGGCVLGGLAAVPASKIAGRDMTRIAGADRWTTARLVGNEARALTTCEPPDDPDPDPDPSDSSASLGSDTVSPSSTSPWWRRPRGELQVKVHICTESDFDEFFTRKTRSNLVDELNVRVAPFYSWQSSEILNIHFEVGDVIISDTLADGWHTSTGDTVGRLGPSDCHHTTPSAHVANHYIVYGDDITPSFPDGGAQFASHLSATIVHHVTGSDPASLLLRERTLFVVGHELDHNIGLAHINGTPTGNTRLGPDARLGPERLGSLANYPETVRSLRGHVYYPCYYLTQQSWPVGEEHPACALVPLPAPIEVSAVATTDGAVRLVWKPPNNFVNTEPVTGYVIELRDPWQGEIVESHSVSASTTSFTLAPATVASLKRGVEYGLYVAANSAVGIGDWADSGSISHRDNDVQIRVSRRPGTDPIVFGLSWEPYTGARNYKISGFPGCTNRENSTQFCFETTQDTSFELHEWRAGLVLGNTYEIAVFACGVPTATVQLPPAPSGCVLHGTVTIVVGGDSENSIYVNPTPIEDCQGLSPSGTLVSCYRAEWQAHPGETQYVLEVRHCEVDEVARTHRCTSFSGSDYEISGTTVSATLRLEEGKHYELWAYYGCTPATFDSLEGCSDDLRYIRSGVTIPVRDN